MSPEGSPPPPVYTQGRLRVRQARAEEALLVIQARAEEALLVSQARTQEALLVSQARAEESRQVRDSIRRTQPAAGASSACHAEEARLLLV